ncbi:MAG: hypothetical protein ACO1SV_22565 [Fimbriimonas sp.]
MKRLLLLSVIGAFAVGCGGSGSNGNVERFAGEYTGTWVNLADAEDAGTNHWTVSADGTITGQDFDPGRDTTFNVVGRINGGGNVTTVSTPSGGGDGASLNGSLSFDNQNRLTGTLVWGTTPPLSYRYTFTRVQTN